TTYHTSTTPLSCLSLHDPLPISRTHEGDHFVCALPPYRRLRMPHRLALVKLHQQVVRGMLMPRDAKLGIGSGIAGGRRVADRNRSEEHASELQSRVDLVCRLLLE